MAATSLYEFVGFVLLPLLVICPDLRALPGLDFTSALDVHGGRIATTRLEVVVSPCSQP
jgi:hypothetical protein